MNGWRRVLGFHTDEYLHCAHREVVFTTAKEIGAAVSPRTAASPSVLRSPLTEESRQANRQLISRYGAILKCMWQLHSRCANNATGKDSMPRPAPAR
jgi:ATP sulfurylase